MTWLFMLGVAVAFIAIAAVLGAQPKGARPVSRTQLMGVARFVLIIFGLILGFLAFRARGRP
jgi:putative Mn2+ efflux pump MntP